MSACNDDNMSARPMGSRTCLIIRSYGNFFRTHTHTRSLVADWRARTLLTHNIIIVYTVYRDRITDNISCVMHVLLLLLSSCANAVYRYYFRCASKNAS